MNRIKRSELHNIMYNSKERLRSAKQSELLNFLVQKFNCLNNILQIENIKLTLKLNFFNRYFQKWENSNRKNNHFIQTNFNWLNEEIIFDFENLENIPSTSSRCFIIYSSVVCKVIKK